MSQVRTTESTGVWGWLKNLFSGDNPEVITPAEESKEITKDEDKKNKMEEPTDQLKRESPDRQKKSNSSEVFTLKKKSRSYEEIGLLYGLTEDEEDKGKYIAEISANIEGLRNRLDEDIDSVKGRFVELLGMTKEIRQELKFLIDELEGNRNNMINKLSKTMRAILVPSDLSQQKKEEIVNRVLDEDVSAITTAKNNILLAQKTLDGMINSFLAAHPLAQIQDLYNGYLEEMKTYQNSKQELEKGYAAGLAIKRNLDDIEGLDKNDEEE